LSPSSDSQSHGNLRVPFDISGELLPPEVRIGLRLIGKTAVFVAMPKATMNEDGCSVFWQQDVGFARDILTVQSEAVSEAVQERAHEHLRSRIPTPYSRHIPASMFWTDRIHLRAPDPSLTEQRCNRLGY
jgi:hypothetical protein